MPQNPGAEALMPDARATPAKDKALIDAADWRNGSEKDWHTVRAATAALIWSITGIHNDTDTDLSAGLSALSHRRGNEYAKLSILWVPFFYYRYSEAFYDGVYTDDLLDVVREVADFIALAEHLAQNNG